MHQGPFLIMCDMMTKSYDDEGEDDRDYGDNWQADYFTDRVTSVDVKAEDGANVFEYFVNYEDGLRKGQDMWRIM